MSNNRYYMDFKQWFEATSALSQSTDDVNLIDDGDGFSYYFKDYQVVLQKSYYYIYDQKIENVWDISFNKDGGHTPTNIGKDFHFVYSNVIKSIKKLIETNVVDALTFSGATPSQDLLYHAFYKNFLSKEFIKTDGNFYIKKDVLRNVVAKKDPDEQKEIYRNMLGNYRQTLVLNKSKKDAKQKQREIVVTIKSNLGKAAWISSNKQITLVYFINWGEELDVIKINDNNTLNRESIPARWIDNVSIAPPEIQQKVINLIKSNQYFSHVIS